MLNPGLTNTLSGTTNVNITNGFNIPTYDYISLSQNTTQDIWTFKTGGSGGTTVGTVTITYTDTTKSTISNVTKV